MAVERAEHRWQERAERASTRVSTEILGHGPTCAADPDDVDQVLDVLIDNALTHGVGPVLVIASAADGRAAVSVVDRGSGVPADEVARVTERFFRGRAATPGGSGLGLAIARELAERWGGALEFRAGDDGTRVDVWFPMSSDGGPAS